MPGLVDRMAAIAYSSSLFAMYFSFAMVEAKYSKMRGGFCASIELMSRMVGGGRGVGSGSGDGGVTLWMGGSRSGVRLSVSVVESCEKRKLHTGGHIKKRRAIGQELHDVVHDICIFKNMCFSIGSCKG